tara:strand:- start:51 stop:605 length:555 start_codon:yes stop_codon:yes gene_type:complete
MIFSNTKKEIYYLLSLLVRYNDLEIIRDIYNHKKHLEEEETLKWYLSEGKKYNKIKDDLSINYQLFNPYQETYNLLKIHHHKTFHLKILIETFGLVGFSLNEIDNKYSLPTLNQKINILNHFIKNYGIIEIYNKIFQYKCHLTDLRGNQCIRSIILNGGDYNYKTIAIVDDNFIDPVERIPTLI